jgi:transmembrane sensor
VSVVSKNGADNAAAAIKARAAAWLEQRDRENWSNVNQATLDDWLAASLAHRVAFWRLDATWERTERLAALRSGSADDVARTSTRWPAIAAFAFALALFAAFGAVRLVPRLWPDEQVYSTAIGGHKVIALST